MTENAEPLEISPELLARIESIKAKRPRTVLNHILKYGFVTTEELKDLYGYAHAPRAARDVRDCGIQLQTFSMKSSDGRRMAAYRLAGQVDVEQNGAGGRKAFSKSFKVSLLKRDGQFCAICGGNFPGNTLQIDHKVPYTVSGDSENDHNLEDFMLVCGSCNRTKSWECEHCDNGKHQKDIDTCKKCMFGSPKQYEHIALKSRRSLTINWNESEVSDYDSLEKDAHAKSQDVESYAKDILKARPKIDREEPAP